MADLFISWDEYHKKTEELAIKMTVGNSIKLSASLKEG